MSDKVKAIPAGYEGATPYLIIKGAARALEFYKNAFGASEVMRMPGSGGTVGHAEIKKVLRPVANQFYGDRSGSLEGPGQQWHFATHVEDVLSDEMAKRAEAFMKQQGSA